MARPTFIPLGEWLPDFPDYLNTGATVATNVIPDGKSYRPFPNLTVYSGSMGGACKGAIIARDLTGNYYNYAGDASALYVLSNASWSSTTRLAGGAYSVAVDDYWEFTQFGNQVIAVNGSNADVPQMITAGAANFAALGGGPPRAKHIAAVRDFVVLGNLSATATSPQMVRWSAINNAGSWTPDAATLADFQDLPGNGGWVQKIVGGEYGIIFQERAIYRMTFVGSPLVFQFDKVQTNLGAFAPQSVVSYRNFVFFLAEDGFYMFDGNNAVPIGQNKVDRTFFNELSTEYAYKINSAIDPVRKIVAWAYPGPGNTGGICNRILIYNWSTQRWSRIEGLSLEILFRNAGTAANMDSLDSLYPSIDLIPVDFDSSQWAGGAFQFAAFNTSHRLCLFNGSAMAATVESTELILNPSGGLAAFDEVRPVYQGQSASVSIAIGTRHKLAESAVFTAAVRPNSAGFCEVRSTARYHRFRLSTDDNAEFDHLMGFEVFWHLDGER